MKLKIGSKYRISLRECAGNIIYIFGPVTKVTSRWIQVGGPEGHLVPVANIAFIVREDR